MREEASSQGRYIPIPQGWQSISLARRLTKAGLCSYTDLAAGRLNLHDVFQMLRCLDLGDYAEAKAMALSEAEW